MPRIGYNGQPIGENTVALIMDTDGSVFDEAWNWETAQSYAQSGHIVEVLKGDGHLSKADLQRMCNYENELRDDCFGSL